MAKKKTISTQKYNEYNKAVYRLSNVISELLEIPEGAFKHGDYGKFKQIAKYQKKKRKMVKAMARYLKKNGDKELKA